MILVKLSVPPIQTLSFFNANILPLDVINHKAVPAPNIKIDKIKLSNDQKYLLQ